MFFDKGIKDLGMDDIIMIRLPRGYFILVVILLLRIMGLI